MIWFLILVIVAAVVVYRFRLPILAKLLGQSQSRVQRALDRKKRP
jgi:Sec-independent protein translocase protein TatA